MTKHARNYALSQEEVESIIKNIESSEKSRDYDLYIFSTLVFTGMRVNEFVHMRKSWVHINDRKSKELGIKVDSDNINHIEIPSTGYVCDCKECQLQSFFESERKKETIPTNKEWYKQKQKVFLGLRKHGNIKLTREWEPKSEAGHRRIPILFPELEKELTEFFEYHDRIDLDRFNIWYRIKRISDYAAEGRKLYPHVLRATCATLFAWKGWDSDYLKNFMGWSSTAIADIYVKSDENKMLKAIGIIKERW